MRVLSNVFAVMVMLGVASAALAEGGDRAAKPKPDKPKALMGVAVKVEGTNLTIKVGKKDEAKEVVVATDEKTEVKVDGEVKTLADIKEGMQVKVMPDTGTATKIEAKTPKPREPKKDGGKKENGGEKPAGNAE